MAKILFISDNFVDESLGIMYLSSYLKANGHDAALSLLVENKSNEDLLETIEKENPDLIGFSVMTPQVNMFRPIAKMIKERTGRKIIWGGPHCIFMPHDVIEHGEADIICTGEGEKGLLELMNCIERKQDYSLIEGMWVWNDDKWIKNNFRSLESDLDQYSFPDRDLYYDKFPFLGEFSLKRIITQRGCPYNCSFCFEPMFKELYKGRGKTVRRHSIGYVIAEIKELMRKYPTGFIHFSDDSFNLNREWVMEFLPRYKKEIGLPFTCNVSIINLDEEMVEMMKECLCKGVFFGLETGIESVRINLLNKRIPNKKFIETAILLHKYEIKFVTNIMFCLPNETLDDAIETMRFCSSLRPYGIRACILKVYKGTKLAKNLIDTNMCSEEGQFTYKVKSEGNQHDFVKNMIWAGYLFVKFPILLRFAREILTGPVSKISKFLILLNHWQDIKLYELSLFQAWKYFWHSRKLFSEGLCKGQADYYRSIESKKEEYVACDKFLDEKPE